MRAMVSFGPPARNPTTNLIGRDGNFSAAVAGSPAASSPSSTAMKRAARMSTSLWSRAHPRGGGGKSEPALADLDGVAGAERSPERQRGPRRQAAQLAGDGDDLPGGARR